MKRYAALAASLAAQGCTMKRKSCGWWVGFPNGQTTMFHLTPSDHRADMNLRACIRRNGMEWPFDKH